MLTKAKEVRDDKMKLINRWDEVVPALDDKCLVLLPWCERVACEEDIKERTTRR
jgi:prolyl-tRNA synthetase